MLALKGLIKRDYLINKLDESKNYPITIITAPAGFGKSTLVKQWLEHINSTDYLFIYCNEFINNPFLFFKNLVIEIQKSFKENFCGSFCEQLSFQSIEESNYFLGLIINELKSYKFRLKIIFEDFHLIDDEKTIKLFYKLLKNLPENIKVYITSRAENIIPITSLFYNNKLLLLNYSELKLSFDEIKNFYKSKNFNLKDDEILSIQYKSGGWILSLQLSWLYYQKTNDIKAILNQQSNLLSDFILEELLADKEIELYQFILKTSFLKSFNSEICNYLLGINNSHEIINKLIKFGLFIDEDDSGNYKYLEVFSTVLCNHFSSDYPVEFKSLLNKAKLWYESKDNLEASLYYAIESIDLKSIEDLLVKNLEIPYKITKEKKEQLKILLKKLPEDKNFESKILTFYTLFFFFRSFEINEIEKLISKLEIYHRDALSQEEYFWIVLFKCYVMFFQEKILEAESLINSIEFTNLDKNISLLKFFYDIQGTLLHYKNKELDSLHYTDLVLDLLKKENNISEYYSYLSRKAAALYNLLMFDESEEICLKVIKEIESNNISKQSDTIIKVKLNLAFIYYIQNKKEYVNLFQELIDDYKNIIDPSTKALFLLTVLLPSSPIYGTEQAYEYLNDLENFSGKVNFIKSIRMSLKHDSIQSKKIFSELIEAKDVKYNGITLNIIYYLIQNQEFETLSVFISSLKKDDDTYKLDISTILLDIIDLYVQYKKNNNYSKDDFMKILKVTQSKDIISFFVDFTKDFYPLFNTLYSDSNELSKNYLLKILISYKNKYGDLRDKKLLNLKKELTDRELEILDLLEKNYSYNDISSELFLSLNTVKTHVRRMYTKLDVKTKEEAILKYKSSSN